MLVLSVLQGFPILVARDGARNLTAVSFTLVFKRSLDVVPSVYSVLVVRKGLTNWVDSARDSRHPTDSDRYRRAKWVSLLLLGPSSRRSSLIEQSWRLKTSPYGSSSPSWNASPNVRDCGSVIGSSGQSCLGSGRIGAPRFSSFSLTP